MSLNENELNFWNKYKATLDSNRTIEGSFVEASPAGNFDITDGLLDLYLNGKKTAGSSIVEDFISCDDPLPKINNFWIYLDSKKEPAIILKTIKTMTHKFFNVPESIAIAEGEGDLSLDYWRETHRKLWEPLISGWGVNKIEDATVITEFFEIVYRREDLC